MIDIVTVVHNDSYYDMAVNLRDRICQFEDESDFNFFIHDNRLDNIGFAKGCNAGARWGNSEIIGFLNPDVYVKGQFISKVKSALAPEVVKVTGCRFKKPDSHLREWGVENWVCGAVFFVDRSYFERLGGFDEGFEWSFEETDFIRRTEEDGFKVTSIDLPITHSSPINDSIVDAKYKEEKFAAAQAYYIKKWG